MVWTVDEVHIIEESAANGSILATEETILHHDRSCDVEDVVNNFKYRAHRKIGARLPADEHASGNDYFSLASP